MSDPFGPKYAAVYDLVYRSKNYERECDSLVRLFGRHSPRPVTSVLDLGCGTGSHALPLARRGYRVTGVDRSEPMLEVARAKARELPSGTVLDFLAGDVREFRAAAPVDAVIMMFAVLGYQVTDADLASALTTVRANLVAGGLFVFDVWYGPAVERDGPGARSSTIAADGSGETRRVVGGHLDREARTCLVTIELVRSTPDSTVTLSREMHLVRYFFRDELAERLAEARLELLGLTAFPSLDEPIDEKSWNVLGVARAADF